MKDLYAELFMLLMRSVEEEPGEPNFGGADEAIEQLMLTIDDTTRQFVREVRVARNEETVPNALDGEILRFEEQMKDGLLTMHQRVQQRMEQMARDRDEIKSRLQLIQRKRSGARGYRKSSLARFGPRETQI